MAESVGADPRIGTEVAGYRIESLAGRGGMGVVYLAEQLALKRRVALKLLAPELAEDARFRERFLRESALAASLEHPSVIPIHDAGEADGVLYLAMRYVEGTDLHRLLAEEGWLAPERAVAILELVAAALDAAHSRGLVHRDVKPANILLARGDEAGEQVYLSDFGLTRQTAEDGSLAETGDVVGTIDYIAPEQVEGRAVGGRAEQYALACVLFECLTGDVPYRDESKLGVLFGHLNEEPPKLTSLKQQTDRILQEPRQSWSPTSQPSAGSATSPRYETRWRNSLKTCSPQAGSPQFLS